MVAKSTNQLDSPDSIGGSLSTPNPSFAGNPDGQCNFFPTIKPVQCWPIPIRHQLWDDVCVASGVSHADRADIGACAPSVVCQDWRIMFAFVALGSNLGDTAEVSATPWRGCKVFPTSLGYAFFPLANQASGLSARVTTISERGGCAPGQDLSVGDKPLEGGDGVGQRMASRPVQR